MLFPATSAASSARLTDKYRPSTIDGFLGLDKAKRICANLAANPFECALMFVGAPGLGKTTLALAFAQLLGADLHHIPSQDCTVDNLRCTLAACAYVPTAGHAWHLVLVDEADQMSAAAQNFLLSKLDATAPPARTIFVFTCNSADRFESRFLSRCLSIEFSSYGIASDAAALLNRVWSMEAPHAPAPNFTRIVKEANNNVRAALMELQKQLLCA